MPDTSIEREDRQPALTPSPIPACLHAAIREWHRQDAEEASRREWERRAEEAHAEAVRAAMQGPSFAEVLCHVLFWLVCGGIVGWVLLMGVRL